MTEVKFPAGAGKRFHSFHTGAGTHLS